jgi:hypothetical protein
MSDELTPRHLDKLIVCHSDLTLGDRVTSKKTGLPAIGKVVAVSTGPVFLQSQNLVIVWKWLDEEETDIECWVVRRSDQIAAYVRWTELYPKWMWEPVIYVEFDEPQRTLSFEEYLDGNNTKDLDESLAKVLYEREVPKAKVASYPIADVEKYG